MSAQQEPLYRWLKIIRQARSARAEAELRLHRDRTSVSDQQWWEGYADGMEDMARGLGIEVRRGGPTCGHSACSQNYIDTGSRRCVTE